MAPPGRKPKPTKLKLVENNPGKRASRKREARPPLDTTLAPPPFLGDDAKVEWGRVVDDLQRCGLLARIDRAALAGYCEAYGTWAQCDRALAAFVQAEQARIYDLMRPLAPEAKAARLMLEAQLSAAGLLATTTNGNVIQNTLIGTRNKAMELVLKFAAEFGMTPSARTRIDVNIGDAAPAAGQGKATGTEDAQPRGGARPGDPGSYIT